jgi:hypothetical protein
MIQRRPRPKCCSWFLTSASSFKFSNKFSEQNMLIYSKTVAFSNRNLTDRISSSYPRKFEIKHNLRDDLKQLGNEFDDHTSSKNKLDP